MWKYGSDDARLHRQTPLPQRRAGLARRAQAEALAWSAHLPHARRLSLPAVWRVAYREVVQERESRAQVGGGLTTMHLYIWTCLDR